MIEDQGAFEPGGDGGDTAVLLIADDDRALFEAATWACEQLILVLGDGRRLTSEEMLVLPPQELVAAPPPSDASVNEAERGVLTMAHRQQDDTPVLLAFGCGRFRLGDPGDMSAFWTAVGQDGGDAILERVDNVIAYDAMGILVEYRHDRTTGDVADGGQATFRVARRVADRMRHAVDAAAS